MEPRSPRARQGTVYGALGSGALALGALAYVGLGDPHRPGFLFPPCPFRLMTGWNCPGCGGLRMTHDLLHGNLHQAVIDNVFLLAGIPALIGWLLWRRHTGRPLATPMMIATVVVAAIAWTVVRNMPGFPLVPTFYGG